MLEEMHKDKKNTSELILCRFQAWKKVDGAGKIMKNWSKQSRFHSFLNAKTFLTWWKNIKPHGLSVNQFPLKMSQTIILL